MPPKKDQVRAQVPMGRLLEVAVTELHLDKYNPRLPEELQGASEEDVLEYLYINGVLGELAQSFVDNGYFVAEPLIVTARPRTQGYTVLEGNRRFATLAVLLGLPIARKMNFGDIAPTPEQISVLRMIPSYIVNDRSDVGPFIGFRHIGGLKMWGPEAKARYVFREVDEARKAGSENPFVAVARRVGSSSAAIRASYQAFAILKYAREGLSINVTGMLQSNRFGVWHRALSSPDLREYINFQSASEYDDVRHSVEQISEKHLKEVISDLLPNPNTGVPLVSDSRLITDYGRILVNKVARKVLRTYNSLDMAREIVSTADFPSRIAKLTAQASIIRTELSRKNITKEVKEAINELVAEVRQMKGLASTDGDI